MLLLCRNETGARYTAGVIDYFVFSQTTLVGVIQLYARSFAYVDLEWWFSGELSRAKPSPGSTGPRFATSILESIFRNYVYTAFARVRNYNGSLTFLFFALVSSRMFFAYTVECSGAFHTTTTSLEIQFTKAILWQLHFNTRIIGDLRHIAFSLLRCCSPTLNRPFDFLETPINRRSSRRFPINLSISRCFPQQP